MKKLTNYIRSKISIKSLILLLFISIVPMITISFISYHLSVLAKEKSKKSELIALTKLRSNLLESYLKDRIDNISFLSKSSIVLKAIKKNSFYEKKGLNSIKNNYLNREDKHYLNYFLKKYNYYDLFFITTKGRIFFSMKEEKDLGTNLIKGSYKQSKLAKVYNKSVKHLMPIVSGLEYYEPSKRYSLFISIPIIKNKKLIGVLIAQLSLDDINKLVNNNIGLGKTGEIILAKEIEDHVVFITPVRHDRFAAFKRKIKIGSLKGIPIQKAALGNDGFGKFVDYRNKEILAAWKYLPNYKCGIVLKIDIKEAFSEILYFQKIMIVIMILTFFFVLIIVFYFKYTFVDPIVRITDISKNISKGILTERIYIKSKDEIGILANTFNKMMNYLLDFANVSRKLSLGDTNVEIKAQSDNDLLANTTNEMIYRLNDLIEQSDKISKGNYEIFFRPRSEKDKLGISIQKMTQTLKQITLANDEQTWLAEGESKINDITRGETNIKKMAKLICSFLAKYLDSQILTFYVIEKGKLYFVGGYAVDEEKIKDTIEFGEGFVGQAALQKEIIVVNNVPNNYLQVNSSIGNSNPNKIVSVPLCIGDVVYGAIEIGLFSEVTKNKIELLEILKENLGITVSSIVSQSRTKDLLEKTQKQSEELQTQQEELRVSNESLKEKTEYLQTSEEELRVSNEELEEKTKVLQDQKKEIEYSKAQLEVKSKDLATASSYKSQFLANMSHELRTPLNSFLLLSKNLSSNKKGNLLPEQIEDLNVIYQGGNELLHLINDIMDLSKVEAGMLSLHIEEIYLNDVSKNLSNLFRLLVEEKGLDFTIEIEKDVVEKIKTDSQRLEQILKNFLSNSFKFTEKGFVQLKIFNVNNLSTPFLDESLKDRKCIGFAVKDSGIGIAKEKQENIFEAFEQQDGSISRKYGGTGLGLTISRELAKILGGEIHLSSEEGKGTTFTFFLDVDENIKKNEVIDVLVDQSKINVEKSIKNTKKNKEDNPILIVGGDEDDQKDINQILVKKEMSVENVLTGAEAFSKIVSKKYSCVVLDVDLSDISAIDFVKKVNNEKLIDNPQFIVYSTRELTLIERDELDKYLVKLVLKDEEPLETMLEEALTFMKNNKLIKNDEKIIYNFHDEIKILKNRKILLVDDDMRNTFALSKSLQDFGIIVFEADNGKSAIDKLKEIDDIELIIMDIMMPVMDGYEAIRKIRKDSNYKEVPIIALTAKAMLEDRKKSIDAGATDYLTKPVDLEKLIAMIKIWLFKK